MIARPAELLTKDEARVWRRTFAKLPELLRLNDIRHTAHTAHFK